MATRRERVVLELEDAGFTTRMAKAAAATALLDKNLDKLDGTGVRTGRELDKTATSVDGLGSSFRRNGSDIDQFSGRIRFAVDALAAFGPALIPLGAVGVPALTGLASAFGFTAIGAGSAAVAFSGVGDALDSLRKAQLEPTTANLEAASQAMDQIGPHAQAFAQELVAMGPALREVRDSAAAGLFPGLIESLDNVESVLPRVASLFEAVGTAVGDLAADATGSLAGPEWAEFFTFIETEGPAALSQLGAALGDTAHGFAELWVAFAPLNRDFSGWLRDSASAFNEWSSGISQTQGFSEFVAYIRDSGPLVADALGSIGEALVEVVQAAAPLGGPVLQIVSSFADAFALLAGSAAGPALFSLAAGMAAVSRSTKILGPGLGSMSDAFLDLRTSPDRAATAMERFGGAARLAAGGAGVALFAHSLGEADDGLRAFEGAMGGALAGLSTGSPWGVAIGGAAGLFASLAAGSKETTAQIDAMTDSLIQSKGAIDDAFRSLVIDPLESGGILETAEKLGLNLDQVTDAALGNKDALAAVNAELQVFLDQTTGENARALADSDMQQLNKDATDVREAITGQNAAVEESVGKFRRYSEAMGESGDAARDAAGGYRSAAGAAERYSDALAALNGWLDKREALRGYDDALRTLTKGLKNGFTRQDSANVDAFGRSIQRTYDIIQGRGRKAEFLQSTIASLRTMMQDAGPRAQAVLQQLINKLKEIDRSAPEPKFKADPSPVTKAVAAARAALRQLDGDTATTYIRAVRIGALGEMGIGPERGNAEFDTGGYTGRGGRLEPAGIVHRGEVVLPQDIVQRDASMLRSLYGFLPGMGSLPGYEIGGYVGSNFGSTSYSNPLRGGGDETLAELLDSLQWFTNGLHDMSAKELKIRLHDLDLTEKQFGKILDKREERAKKEADADKARLDSILETQRAFEEQVSGLFKSDVFAKGDEKMFAVFPDGSRVPLENGLTGITEAQGRYMEAAGVRYEAEGGVGGAADILGGDIQGLQESIRLIRELRDKGFDGPAFQELVGEAANDPESLSFYAGMSRGELDNLENLYGQRDQLMGTVGNIAGKDFDPKIAILAKRAEESVTELRETKQEIRSLRREVAELKELERKSPQLTGKAVGDAVNGAMTNGARGR
jgi:hypothetical protein